LMIDSASGLMAPVTLKANSTSKAQRLRVASPVEQQEQTRHTQQHAALDCVTQCDIHVPSLISDSQCDLGQGLAPGLPIQQPARWIPILPVWQTPTRRWCCDSTGAFFRQ
jgi:hypothetical protein